MNLWRSIGGILEGELTSADPGQALNLINHQNIPLYSIETDGELTLCFQFSGADRKKLEQLCRIRGYSLCIRRRKGLRYALDVFSKRPLLIAGGVTFFLLTWLLPTRIFFFQVEGNQNLPDRIILEAAEECGIGFGISGRTVRSEKMKNALLDRLPELEWAGINTYGCRAVISVREEEKQQKAKEMQNYGSIVATRDGYITSCTVTRGNPVCAVGDTVKEGQLLISGYTDCGICLQVTQAQGEITAQTQRSLTSVLPSIRLNRYRCVGVHKNYSIVIGKKRINLWKYSGISGATCGRIYKEYYLTLPGGLRFPICLAVESITSWETEKKTVKAEDMKVTMSEYLRKYLLQQMTAGQILQEVYTVRCSDSAIRLQGEYICSEMIGRAITEENGEFNGKVN